MTLWRTPLRDPRAVGMPGARTFRDVTVLDVSSTSLLIEASGRSDPPVGEPRYMVVDGCWGQGWIERSYGAIGAKGIHLIRFASLDEGFADALMAVAERRGGQIEVVHNPDPAELERIHGLIRRRGNQERA